MARTAKTNLKLRNSGAPLGAGAFDTLDLAGITATDSGGGVALLTSSGSSGTNVATDVLTATQSGANITLDLTTAVHTVVAVEVVFRNGQALKPTTFWTQSGTTITVFNADAGEVFMVQYTW